MSNFLPLPFFFWLRIHKLLLSINCNSMLLSVVCPKLSHCHTKIEDKIAVQDGNSMSRTNTTNQLYHFYYTLPNKWKD